MDEPNISVIVPVYNAEKYLEHCINSILKQTFNDFELLLIDDCSNDKSLEICKKYAQIDKRVKTYHKEINEGTAQSRKTGIFYATAEYVIFVDNDDWIEPEMLEELYQKAFSENYDMVYCDFYYGKKYIKQNYTNSNNYELIKQVISCSNFFPVTWNKLVRKEVYNKIVFPSTIFSEDRPIMVQVLYNCKTIGYLDKAFYHWRIHQKSASHNKRDGIKNLIDDYISYISIIIFIKNITENTSEYFNEIVNHVDIMTDLCSGNKKIIDEYKYSMKNIIKIINENGNVPDMINFERQIFEEKIKDLDKKYTLKKIIKGIIPKFLKRWIKEIFKYGYDKQKF